MSNTEILTFVPGEEEKLRLELFLPNTVSIPAISEQINVTRGEIVQFRREISGTIDPMKLQIEAQKFLDRKYAEGRRDTQKAAVTGTTDVKLDMAGNAIHASPGITADITVMRSIDWQKPVESQDQALSTVSWALGTIATKLSKPGQKPEDFDSLEKLAKLDLRKYPDLNTQEKNAVELIRIGLGKGDTPVLTHMRTEWTEKLRTQAPYGAALGEFQQVAKTGDWTSLSMDNPIMEFAKEHKVIAGLAVAGVAFGLYKFFGGMFGGGDDKKEDSKGGKKDFMDSFTEYIPGGKASIGVLIALVAAVGIFKPEWLKSLWDKITGSNDKGKIAPKTAGEVAKYLRDPKNSREDKQKMVLKYKEDLPMSMQALIVAFSSLSGVDIDNSLIKLADGLDAISRSGENESHANPEAVALSRVYQGYYGFLKPFNEMPAHHKRYYESRLGLHTGFTQATRHGDAQKMLPGLESQYDALAKTPAQSISQAETRIAAEFAQPNGHPTLGTLEKNMNEMTPIQRKLVGLPESGPLDVTAHKSKFIQYMAIQEVNIDTRGLEYHITAIKSGPQGYDEFLKAKNLGHAEYYRQLQAFEMHRASQHLGMNTQILEAKHIQGFVDLQNRFEGLVGQKDVQVRNLLNEIMDIQTKEGYVRPASGGTLTSADIAKNQAIDAKCEQQVRRIAAIEHDVSMIGQKFLKENEAKLTEMANHSGTKTSLAYKFKSLIPNTHGAVGGGVFATGRNLFSSITSRAPEQLSDLRFGPEVKRSQIFRFGSVGGVFIITGLGAGYAWYKGDISQAKETAERIAWGFVPIVGTGLDFEDMISSFKDGKLMEGSINAASFIMSGCSDVLLATGILSWAGVGLKATVQPLIRSGLVKTAHVAADGTKIILKGAEGKVLQEISLTGTEAVKFAKIRELIKFQQGTVANYAQKGMVGGMVATLGLGGASIAAGYMDNGKLKVESTAPSLPEDKGWFHGSAGVK